MLFTIAIPVYNGASIVGKAIRSAIQQDYDRDFEILIVNNASTDNTLEVVNTFTDSHIRIITNPETVDQFSNHNVCFKEAKGDYIIFCHADDELTRSALTILADKLKQRHYPQKYIVWGRSMYYDFLFSINIGQGQLNTVITGITAVKCFLGGGLTPSGTCYSRQAIIDIGLFPKMKHRLEPLDWYILVVAVFNHFEFEMIDRLLFIREFASTATSDVKDEEWIEANRHCFEDLRKNLDEIHFNTFIAEVYKYLDSFSFEYTRPFLNDEQIINYQNRIKADRITLKHIIKLNYKYLRQNFIK